MSLPSDPMIVALIIAPFLVWAAHWKKVRQVQAHQGLYEQLLSKFSTAEEITRFMETESGRRLLNEMTQTEEDPRMKILGGLFPAFLFSCLGIGFLILAPDVDSELVIPATVFLAMGISFFLAIGVTYHFAKSWRKESASNEGRPEA